MEVLFITHKYPPSIGGMERQSYQLVKGMKGLSKVHLLKPEPGKNLLWWYVSLIWKINHYLSQNPNISIIHANDGLIAILTSFIRNKSKYKLACTIHGLDVTYPNRLYQEFLIPRLKHFDKLMAVSTATEKEILTRGIATSKVCTIHNGVDAAIADIPVDKEFLNDLFEELNIDIDKKILISTGRAVRRKGFSWFVKEVLPSLDNDTVYLIIGPTSATTSWMHRAVSMLPDFISDKINMMMGFADDTAELESLSKDEKYKGKFYHLGKLSFLQMMTCVSIADLFIMPNIKVRGDFEGFGLVSLEANMRDKMVIAADLEGIKDAVVNGQNGIRIPSGDVAAWIKTINRMYAKDCDLVSQGKKAKEYVQDNFSWDTMVMSYYEEFSYLYDTMLSEHMITEAIPSVS